MKIIKKIAALAMIAVAGLMASPNASAFGPFRFGVKLGTAVNNLHFNESVLSSENRAGFTGGLTCQFAMPLTGIGFDISAMYTYRSNKVDFEPVDGAVVPGTEKLRRHYFELPVNLRWEMNILGIGSFIKPYIFTGPDFSFLLSKQNAENAWKEKKVDVAWNFGLGLQFVQRVQIAASYGVGITKSASGEDALYSTGFNARNRFWTITAAYLF